MRTYVLYHADCQDGAGAALSAYLVMGDNATYIPVKHGEPIPAMYSGSLVYILDFSYSAHDLLELADKMVGVYILDHHKTAQDSLETLPISHPCIKVVFDMDKSGAMLAWEHFHPATNAPLLIRHLQDRDLWKLEMHGSKKIYWALGMYEDWRDWARFLYEVRPLIAHGDAIERYLQVQAARIIGDAPREFLDTGDVVPVHNLPGFMITDALHQSLDAHPESPYAVGFVMHAEKTTYSLRSRKTEDVNVSAIASKFGGGGHKHASGFSIPHIKAQG